MCLLDEAIAIKLVSRRQILKKISCEKDNINAEDIAISFLADLHEIHDLKSKHWIEQCQKVCLNETLQIKSVIRSYDVD